MTRTIADVLEKAALLLERDGWCQGMAFNYTTGERCAEGAIWDDEPRPLKWDHERIVLLSKTDVYFSDWLARNGGYIHGIAQYNDEHGRTKADVIGAMRDAARDYRRNLEESHRRGK